MSCKNYKAFSQVIYCREIMPAKDPMMIIAPINARPFLINGPEDIRPLNMATTRPVALITNVSIDVKPNIIGVNITPPPTPAMTAIIAIVVLNKNEATTTPRIKEELRISVPCTRENIPIIIYEAIVKPISKVTSGFLNKKRNYVTINSEYRIPTCKLLGCD